MRKTTVGLGILGILVILVLTLNSVVIHKNNEKIKELKGQVEQYKEEVKEKENEIESKDNELEAANDEISALSAEISDLNDELLQSNDGTQKMQGKQYTGLVYVGEDIEPGAYKIMGEKSIWIDVYSDKDSYNNGDSRDYLFLSQGEVAENWIIRDGEVLDILDATYFQEVE